MIYKEMMKKIMLSWCLLVVAITVMNGQVKFTDDTTAVYSPDINSILELQSPNKGFLPSRVALTSVNAAAPLTAPVTAGMLVYSLGGEISDGYYYWNSTKWVPLNPASVTRNNYVLVKSAADFPAAVGGVITLVAGTLYEINGTILLSNKIDLNDCTIIGEDTTNDKLIYTGSGELFTGAHGGKLRNVSLIATAGKVFNINGGGIANTSLLVEDCYILSSSSVGTVQGMTGYVYFADIGFYANTSGITFQNNAYVYMNGVVWDVSNTNTFETYIGTFSTIQILGGSRNVPTGSTGLNITGQTSISSGSIKSTKFVGTGTLVAGTFSKFWEVEALGLNTEKDDVATGNLYITTPGLTAIATVNVPLKISGTTTSVNLFRFASPASNRLTYTGLKIKRCMVICNLTATFSGGGSNKFFTFSIAKNGTILPESKQKVKLINDTDQTFIGVASMIFLAPNDYIEIWVENNTDAADITALTLNLSVI
ncbi:MAG: hypothetical protein H7X99_09210 [Saprospiraceae bacterium]|nr:hypothetical protein [Saprospiraceae bacterium]